MGLDGIELIIEVENTFGIEIKDKEAETIATVGDFYEVVWNKIKDKESNKCASALIFYRFRKLIVDNCKISKADFLLDKNLNDLIPENGRKETWKDLQSKFEFKLPNLKLPSFLQLVLAILVFLLIFCSLIFSIFAVTIFNFSGQIFLLPVIGIAIMLIIDIVFKPFKTRISKHTIRDFIEEVLTINYKEIQLKFGSNRTEMEKVMNNLICDKLGVKIEELNPKAHFVNDLGLD